MRTIFCVALTSLSMALFLVACTSNPTTRPLKKYAFPKEGVFVGDVKREYQKLGMVRWRENYNSLDVENDEDRLCKNYYNKAVKSLLKVAKDQGGDAVIDVKSVTFLVDGRVETHSTPECSDEGADGQILVQGVAVKWLPPATEPSPNPSPSVSPSPL